MVSPACDFRAVYFALHHYNWYQRASDDELLAYVEQMLLWGYNTIVCIIPIINLNDFEEPLARTSIGKIKGLFRLCRQLGMKTGVILGSNQGFKSAPHEYDAELSYNAMHRGKYGRNLCVSNPDAYAYMQRLWRASLEQFAEEGLDYILMWPYDEGGCGCEKCRPWGANGYCEACKGIYQVGRSVFPNAKYIVSTWYFDVCEDEGEYAGFYRRLAGDMAWADYIMVDNHSEFPRYPLEHDVIRPVVNFPEISMWGLYPWGGFGANPLPRRFQHIWDDSKRILQGGMPYSEGKFEDISKVQCVGYYWDPDRSYKEILSEYISYEYSSEVCEDVLELMEWIEENHVRVFEEKEPDYAAADRALALAKEVDEKLSTRAKSGWRWRILYLRAVLDHKRFAYYAAHKQEEDVYLRLLVRHSGDFLLHDAEAQGFFQELCTYYCCVEYNGENHWTHPPINGGYVNDTRI